MPDTLRVLSLDGGGIRGIVPALVLAAIEAETGHPIAEDFDLIAGTSTGGILAVGLTIKGPDGRPKCSAKQLAELYRQRGGDIFHASVWDKIRHAGNLNGPKYGCAGLEKVLQDFFGDARLKDAVTDVLVTSYEIDQMRDPFFFRSSRASQNPLYDFPARSVARATSAAPTYFEPAKLVANPGDTVPYYALVDGGVFANNPAMCAYAEARATKPDCAILLASVGTGQATEKLSYDQAKGWGLIGWARPVLDVVFDGVADTVDYQLKLLLPGKAQYFRFQTPLDAGEDAMDDVSPANLARLVATADKLVQDRRDDIRQLCEALTAARPAVPA